MSASEGSGTFSNRWGMLLVMLGMAVSAMVLVVVAT